MFYEIVDNETGHKIAGDDLVAFIKDIDAYLAELVAGGDDEDAVNDSFWGGGFNAYVDGYEISPDDLYVGAYWAFNAAGKNSPVDFNPGLIHRIDDLYGNSSEYEDAKIAFEAILQHEFNLDVSDPSVLERFKNPLVIGAATVLDTIRDILYDGGYSSTEAATNGTDIEIWYNQDKYSPDDILKLLSSKGFEAKVRGKYIVVEA